jgi:hypothetical protein
MSIKRRWMTFGALLIVIAVAGWGVTIWKRFLPYQWRQTQTDAQFSISFPSAPTASTETLTAPDGTRFNSNKLTSSPARGVLYAVSWWENSTQNNKSTDELFASFRDCGMKAFHGKMVSENKLFVDGYPAQETAVVSDGGLVAVNRVIRVKSRLYSLWIVDSVGHLERADINRFMNSFAVQSM